MNAADLGQLLEKYPEMLDDGKKFSAILRDVYPTEKGNVNQMIIAYNAGVVSMLRKSDLDSLLTSRIMSLLMDDYGIAEERARWAAELWIEAYNYFQHRSFREQKPQNTTSSMEAEKDDPKDIQAKPVETKKSPLKTAPPVTPGTETAPNCFKVIERDSGCEITNYVGPETGQVVIPAYINGMRVTKIWGNTFRWHKKLTSVIIPQGVTEIQDGAFEGCEGLTSVTIPEGVTKIGREAFYRCESLISVTIPDSVTKIEFYAFCGCTNLTSVVIPKCAITIDRFAFERTPWLESMGEFVVINFILNKYQGCDKFVSIPKGISAIGERAFWDCKSLISVTIPEGVIEIQNGAFKGCENLTSVTIPKGVIEIQDGAFEGCKSLTSVTIPESVTEIGEETFFGCASLTSVTIPEGITEIRDGAFGGCESLTSITIPESVTLIGKEAFCDCTSLTSLTIPEIVTEIGEEAFRCCTSLISITIPNSVKVIGKSAFEGCELASVTIPEGVKIRKECLL